MAGENWFELEALREHQARIYEEHRKVNGAESKLQFMKLFPPGFFYFFKSL
jgi:hypothetical protein